MRLIPSILLLLCLLVAVSMYLVGHRQSVVYAEATDDPQFEIKVKQVIENNPELIVASVMKWQQRNEDSRMQQASSAASVVYDGAISDYTLPRIGNGPTKVVEFYDYRCGYCKKMARIKREYMDKGVEFITIDMPVLGESSLYLAQAMSVVRAIKPEVFAKAHIDLLETRNRDPESAVQRILNKYDIDKRQFSQMMESRETMPQLMNGLQYASSMNLQATPAYIINGKLHMGALSESKFSKLIK